MAFTYEALPKPGTRMTFEEFQALELPEGSSLYLEDGVVYDEGFPEPEDVMTKRNAVHARIEARLTGLLFMWQQEAGRKFELFSGEVGCEAPQFELDVGVDIAVFGAAVLEALGETPFIQGVPILTVEILSPSDSQRTIGRKLKSYLRAQVPLTWVVDPAFQTVVVHRPDEPPKMFVKGESLTAGKLLPGLEIPVSDIFK